MEEKMKLLAAALSFYEEVPTSAQVPFAAYKVDEEETDMFMLLRHAVMNMCSDRAPATEASFAQWGYVIFEAVRMLQDAAQEGDNEQVQYLADLLSRNMHAFSDCMAILADEEHKLHFEGASDVLRALADHLREQGLN